MASALDRLREYWDEVAARNYGQAVQNRSGQSPEGALRDAATFAAEMSIGAALRDAMAESSALMRSALDGEAAGAANSIGPLLGALASVAPAGAAVRRGLDMSKAARMARAENSGFRTSEPLYHHSPVADIEILAREFEQGDPARRARYGGVFLSTDPESAKSASFAKNRAHEPHEMFAAGRIFDGSTATPSEIATLAKAIMRKGDIPDNIADMRKSIREHKNWIVADDLYNDAAGLLQYNTDALLDLGYAGASAPNRKYGKTVMMVDPSYLRSSQAAFDPAHRDSSNLLYANGGAVMSPSIKSLADYLEWKRFADGGDADGDGDGDSDGGADSYSDGPGDDGSSGRSSEVTPGIASEVDPSDAFGFGEGYSGLGMANPGFFNDPMGWAAYQAYKAVENPVQTLANYAFGVPYMSQGLNAAAQAIGQGIAGLTGTDPNAVEGAETGHPGVDMSGTQPIPMPQQPPQPPMPQPQQPPMPPQPGPQPIPQPPTPYTPSLADLDYIKRPLYMAMGGAVAPDIVGGGINRPAMFADGGTVSGLIGGGTPGRADAVPASLEQDGYVIPADVVSAMGDGNTQAGAIALSSALGGSPYQASMADGGILARVAHGEYYLDPDDVQSAGGPRRLDQFVKSTRAGYIDKLKKLKGPRDG